MDPPFSASVSRGGSNQYTSYHLFYRCPCCTIVSNLYFKELIIILQLFPKKVIFYLQFLHSAILHYFIPLFLKVNLLRNNPPIRNNGTPITTRRTRILGRV